MAIQDRTELTVEEFDRLALLPENADRLLEYVGGRIVEVVSNNLSSAIAQIISGELYLFLREHALGFLTGADGGYVIAGERYIPDVAFISKQRQSKPSQEAYNANAPDLAVEVLSPSNSDTDMRIKVVNYLRAGTTVWIVDPDKRQVEIYVPDKPPKTLGMNSVLDGGDLLPGLVLPVRRLFEPLAP